MENYINDYDTDFIKVLKEEIIERLNDRINQECYPGDIGFLLTDTENADGSWYCSEYSAKEDLKKYFDEFLSYQGWYHTEFGEPDWFEAEPDDYHHSVESVHCRFMILSIEIAFNIALSKTDYYSDEDKITITEDFINDIKTALSEISDINDIF